MRLLAGLRGEPVRIPGLERINSMSGRLLRIRDLEKLAQKAGKGSGKGSNRRLPSWSLPMHMVLDAAVRSVSLRACRARCESSIRERFTIRLRQCYGGPRVVARAGTPGG